MTSASQPDEAAAALAQDGLNRLQGLVGPLPEAAAALRSAYLNWADQVERLLRGRGAIDASTEAALHSPRHRDLVAGVIPNDVLAREVLAERDVRLQLLDELKEAPATGIGAAPAPVELSGRQGEIYRYFLDRPLGGGGFGQVYEATTVDGLALAVKRVPLRTASTARWYADARLAERELEVALRLGLTTEENVLPVLDHVLDEEALLLVMPRAEHSLADVIAGGGRLDEADVRSLLLDLAAGMRLLADRGVVHRDIKPGNVLWWRNRWVLSDLGVARIIQADTSTYTWAGTGSPSYWAPELFAFEPATVRSDLYALGCTAFEALTGTPPFTGDDLATAHRTAVPELPAIADAALNRTLRRLLSKEPAARPVDAREVEQLLVPAEGLGPDQAALLRFAAHALKENEQQAQRSRAAQQEDARRRDARFAFARIWEDAVARARQVLPDAEGFEQDGTWFLRVLGTRLTVTLAEPSSSTAALLIGLVRVQFVDQPHSLNPANVRGRHQDGRAVWELLTFQHNLISTERPPLGPARGPVGAPAGMSVSHLDGLLDRLDLPGPPVVITHSIPLSLESLLQIIVDALED